MHFLQVPPQDLETLGILSLVSGFFSILACGTGMTSFALTLLRLSDGWLKITIWVIFVSMNILMPMSALFLWVSCNPPAKTVCRRCLVHPSCHSVRLGCGRDMDCHLGA